MDTVSSPLLQRRRLRTELRRARIEANLTQEQVAQTLDWSLSKIIRIETGPARISTNDLKALLGLYQIRDSNRTAELIEPVRACHQEFEIYSKRLDELIEKLSQIRLSKKELRKVLKAIGKPGGREDIDSWFSRRRDVARGIFYVLSGGFFVLFSAIMAIIASAKGIPAGEVGFGAFISPVALLACCIISAVYCYWKASSIDRKREQVRAAIDAYREPS
jgi:transcriptional regulator with XRE-family HTH domain